MPITRTRFEELVAEAIDGLPAWVLEAWTTSRCWWRTCRRPDNPDLLGLYHGIPLSRRGAGYTNVLPDTITLYRCDDMRVAGPDEERVRRQVARTVAHEVAHHFGISDERLLEIDAY